MPADEDDQHAALKIGGRLIKSPIGTDRFKGLATNTLALAEAWI
jgi:hypothetical protein